MQRRSGTAGGGGAKQGLEHGAIEKTKDENKVLEECNINGEHSQSIRIKSRYVRINVHGNYVLIVIVITVVITRSNIFTLAL
jgi:hypothetical protein